MTCSDVEPNYRIESDSNREQTKTYIKYYILTSYKPMMRICRITSNLQIFKF